MYALVDCNNFYASCQRAFQPELEGKPVVVLSNNDGCAIARSNEAKALGIKMGAPFFELKDIIQKHNVKVFSSNYELYGDMSKRVMKTLSEFTPEVEVYSIDEIFLKFKGFENYNFKEYGIKMRTRVKQYCWLPVSVGFAPTKALAKVANKIAKKYSDRLNGVYVIDTEEKRIKALKWLEIGDVWGIGRQFQKKLLGWGVDNAYKFTLLDDYTVLKEMSIVGLRLKKELEGINHLELEEKKRKKNIATTRSFASDVREFEGVRERVSTFAVRCAEKLRKEKSYCNRITVFVVTNSFRKDQPQYGNKVTLKLPYPTNSDITLSKYATRALEIIFRDGFAYKKAGVIVHEITPEPFKQGNLFFNEDPRHEKIMKVMDALNLCQLDPVVRLASQDIKKREKMRQEKLSPYYTTRWDDIIEIA